MRWALLLIVAITLAGCSGTPTQKTFTVPEDAGSEADTHTGDGYDLKVRVVDESGAPIEGAAVVYFAEDEGFFDLDASAGASGDGADAAVYYRADFGSYDMIAGVRTDSQGMVSVDLEPGRDLNVAAGDVDGMTTEVLPNIVAGDGGKSGTVEVRLYPDHVSYTFEVSAGNEVGRARLMQGTPQTFPVELAGEAASHDAYQARLYEFDLTANWTNAMDRGADFYVAAGSEDGIYWEGDDEQQLVFDGAHSETLHVEDEELYEHIAEIGDDGLYLHLMTDWASLGFEDIPVEVTIEADLKGSNVVIN